jgi:hypothetical protein
VVYWDVGVPRCNEGDAATGGSLADGCVPVSVCVCVCVCVCVFEASSLRYIDK